MTNDTRLDRTAVAALVGWSDPNHVNVARRRTRAGTASVPFPEPDSETLLEKRVNRQTHEDWWFPATIERYIIARRSTRSRARKVDPAMAERIRVLRTVDKYSVERIAVMTRVSKATVSRVLNSQPPQENDHGNRS